MPVNGIVLDHTETLIDNMGNLIDPYTDGTSRTAEFELKSRLIELGVRSNSATLTIQDVTTGNPIAGAMAACGTKTVLGTPGGVALFESVRTGNKPLPILLPDMPRLPWQ